MRVRIVSGQFGGRFIASPNTDRTHPMSERVKGAMFNVIGSVADMNVLDAFAGTGALGFEALSRGASRATFIEKDRLAHKVIADNAELLDVNDRTKIVNTSVASWDTSSVDEQFDIIFADPPYHDVQFSTVLRLFAHLKPNGLMILSHPGRESAPTVNGVVVVDNRSYGDAALAFYRKEAVS